MKVRLVPAVRMVNGQRVETMVPDRPLHREHKPHDPRFVGVRTVMTQEPRASVMHHGHVARHWV